MAESLMLTLGSDGWMLTLGTKSSRLRKTNVVIKNWDWIDWSSAHVYF